MTQELFERIVARVLRIGVTVSATLIILGFAAALVVGWGGSGSNPGTPTDTTDFANLADRLRAFQPLGIVQLGLLVLIATPVVRVTVSVVGFALEYDRLYVAITLAVLTILLASLFLAR